MIWTFEHKAQVFCVAIGHVLFLNWGKHNFFWFLIKKESACKVQEWACSKHWMGISYYFISAFTGTVKASSE